VLRLLISTISYQSAATKSYDTTYNPGANYVAEQWQAQAQRVHASSEMSSEVAHVLHFLERDLLDDEADETDVAASLSQECNTGSDGNWADTLEELLAVESSPLYS
jgi:hypothetical protein